MRPLPLENKHNTSQKALPVLLEGIYIPPKREEVLKSLEKKLGYVFDNLLLLEKALIHPSCSIRPKNQLLNNERLEFLGDAILNLIISESLMKLSHKNIQEGELSCLRARIVNKPSLHTIALLLDIPSVIRVGQNEKKKNIHHTPSILANAVEAIIAAIYLDSDFETTYQTVFRLMQNLIMERLSTNHDENYKGSLQQLVQKEHKTVPTYLVEETKGPSHKKSYSISCVILGKKYGCGTGQSKKVAEQMAAKRTLEMLKTG